LRFRRNNGERLRAMAGRCFASACRLLAPVCFLIAFCAGGTLRAQIQIRVILEHRAYLVGEPFAVQVQIENQLSVPMVERIWFTASAIGKGRGASMHSL